MPCINVHTLGEITKKFFLKTEIDNTFCCRVPVLGICANIDTPTSSCLLLYPQPPLLYSCPSLQILFDLGCVGSIEALQFLVEFHVTLVDVVNIRIFIKCSATAVFLSLFYSEKKIFLKNNTKKFTDPTYSLSSLIH